MRRGPTAQILGRRVAPIPNPPRVSRWGPFLALHARVGLFLRDAQAGLFLQGDEDGGVALGVALARLSLPPCLLPFLALNTLGREQIRSPGC